MKPSKYRAVKTTVDGITFDSKKEARRYQELKALEKAGEIQILELQPRLAIYVVPNHQAAGAPVLERINCGEYVADFAYYEHGKNARVYEDAKGYKTDVYRLKKKLVEGIYGITIREV